MYRFRLRYLGPGGVRGTASSPLPRQVIGLPTVITRAGKSLVRSAQHGIRPGLSRLAFSRGRPFWLRRVENTIVAVFRKCSRSSHGYHIWTRGGDVCSSIGPDGSLNSPISQSLWSPDYPGASPPSADSILTGILRRSTRQSSTGIYASIQCDEISSIQRFTLRLPGSQPGSSRRGLVSAVAVVGPIRIRKARRV